MQVGVLRGPLGGPRATWGELGGSWDVPGGCLEVLGDSLGSFAGPWTSLGSGLEGKSSNTWSKDADFAISVISSHLVVFVTLVICAILHICCWDVSAGEVGAKRRVPVFRRSPGGCVRLEGPLGIPGLAQASTDLLGECPPSGWAEWFR